MKEELPVSWLYQNVSATLLTATAGGGLVRLFQMLYDLWDRYRSLLTEAKNLADKFEKVHHALRHLRTTFEQSEFENILKECEPDQLRKLEKSIERLRDRVKTIKDAIEPFQKADTATETGDPQSSREESTFRDRLQIARKNSVIELEKLIKNFDDDLKEVREESAELVIHYRHRLSKSFVLAAVARTRYWWANQMYETMTLSDFTDVEIRQFSLQSYRALESRNNQFPLSSNLCPVSWYQYTDRDGQSGYVLVEVKIGPYRSSPGLFLEDATQNLTSAYGLVRQFRVANRGPKDKFSVLPCRGIYYNDENLERREVLLVWDPPIQVQTPKDVKITTLQEVLGHMRNSVNALRNIAKRLVSTVYELLNARWHHRNISLHNIIAFNDDWNQPYLMGFGTARFINGHSDPASRPETNSWSERYIQHPDRYKGKKPTNCRFRMKHDIYGLGIVLLEMQKGLYFGNAPIAWHEYDEEGLREALVKYSRVKTRLLGDAFVDPIVHCLHGFDCVDVGADEKCQPYVLSSFRRKVLDPIMEAMIIE